MGFATTWSVLFRCRVYLLFGGFGLKISACIICNDNPKVFDCIKSVKSSCFEILVGYNGKSKSFRDKLVKTGVKVYDYKWRNNFSHARNFVISKAAGDWILTIDSDEVLKSPMPELKTKFDFYFLRVENGNEWHYNIRLFKNNIGIKYENKIHESVEKCCKNLPGAKTEIYLVHSGIDNEDEYLSKLTRNFDILKKDKSNIAKDMHYCRHYYATKDYKKAIKYGMKLLRKEGINNDMKAITCIIIFECYKCLGFGDMGIDFLRLSIQLVPLQVLSRYLIVNYLYSLKQIKHKKLIMEQLQVIGSIITHKNSELSNEIYIPINYVNKKIKELEKWH